MATTLRFDVRRTVMVLKRNPVLRAAILAVGVVVRGLSGALGAFSDGRGMRALSASAHPAARKVSAALAALSEPPPPVTGNIEGFRLETIRHTEPLIDGSLKGAGPSDAGIRVGEACRVSKPPRQCLLLYLLAREFGARSILELGTNLGISSAYLACAPSARVVTLDASPYRLRIAGRLHESLGPRNVERIAGRFNHSLPGVLRSDRRFALVFIDGHHRYQSTVEYCALILPFAAPGAVFVFDDIRWSGEMKKAWREVRNNAGFCFSADLEEFGLCVVRAPADPDGSEAIPRIDGWLRARGPLAARNPH